MKKTTIKNKTKVIKIQFKWHEFNLYTIFHLFSLFFKNLLYFSMGITIHYKGKLNNEELIIPFKDEMIDIAGEMGWKYSIIDEDLNAPNTAHLEDGKIEGTAPLKGIMIDVHKDAESLSLLFDKDGNIRNIVSMAFETRDKEMSLDNFIKTQFAPVDVHITVIKLLKYLKKKYISNLDVIDEGMYWETEDKELLTEKISFPNKMMDKLEAALSQVPKDENETPESISDKIEEVLKKKFGFK